MSAGRIAIATLVAGVLDIGIALIFAWTINGTSPSRVLSGIAMGPFGSAVRDVPWAPIAGLAIHFAIMTAMVAAFALAVSRFPAPMVRLGPVLTGALYGLGLYAFMYWIVLPMRWPQIHPVTELAPIARAVFAHVVMVGLPIAFLLRPRGAAPALIIPATAGP